MQLDNITRSGVSWRASDETQYVDRYVAYLWHAGETGSPNRMHFTQVHGKRYNDDQVSLKRRLVLRLLG